MPPRPRLHLHAIHAHISWTPATTTHHRACSCPGWHHVSRHAHSVFVSHVSQFMFIRIASSAWRRWSLWACVWRVVLVRSKQCPAHEQLPCAHVGCVCGVEATLHCYALRFDIYLQIEMRKIKMKSSIDYSLIKLVRVIFNEWFGWNYFILFSLSVQLYQQKPVPSPVKNESLYTPGGSSTPCKKKKTNKDHSHNHPR